MARSPKTIADNPSRGLPVPGEGPPTRTGSQALPWRRELYARMLALGQDPYEAFAAAGFATTSAAWRQNARSMSTDKAIIARTEWIKANGLDEDDFIDDSVRKLVAGEMGSFEELPKSWLIQQAAINMALCRSYGDTKGANELWWALAELAGVSLTGPVPTHLTSAKTLRTLPTGLVDPKGNTPNRPIDDATVSAFEDTEERIDGVQRARRRNEGEAEEIDSALEQLFERAGNSDQAEPSGDGEAGSDGVSR